MNKKNIKTGKTGNEKTNKNIKKNVIVLIFILCVLTAVMFLIRRKDLSDLQKKQKTGIALEKKIVITITDLIIEPDKPQSSSITRIIPVIKEKIQAEYGFKYRWFVNGKEIPGEDSCVLPEHYRKKHNRIYCRVRAVAGDYRSKEKKSKEFAIANSPPVFNHRSVGKFKVPGDFSYKIDAFDPDGDKIEFNLIAPHGMGVKVNRSTGEIRWSIPALPQEEKVTNVRPAVEEGSESTVSEETPSESDNIDKTKVLIVVEIKDSDGAVTRAALLLDLVHGGEVTM